MRLATFAVSALLVLAAGCSRAEEETPREPWLAEGHGDGRVLDLKTYRVDRRAQVLFTLRGKEETIQGRVELARGELRLDPQALSSLTGVLELDLGALRILEPQKDEDAEPRADRARSARAHNWLGIGSSRPEATRERLRWARFEIRRVEGLSASSVDRGRKQKVAAPAPADAGTDAASAGPPSRRLVKATLVGDLTVHGFRVEQVLGVKLLFTHPTPDAAPTAVEIEAARPFYVDLPVHDIKPRDARGMFLAAQLPLLGKVVGRRAGVIGHLTATLQP